MPTLLTRLQALDPSALWALAPRHTLMQGSGLLATGELLNWSWKDEFQLDGEFPQRLDTLICRLRLNSDKLESICDCRAPRPCQHHVAMLMTAVHLLKDFHAFGRYPSRTIAERLRLKLDGGTRPTVQASEVLRTHTRHVLIRPRAEQRFAYRLSFAPEVDDVTATLPPAMTGFVSAWTHTPEVEEAFWQWFSSPARKMPVFVQLSDRIAPVKSRLPAGLNAQLRLNHTAERIVVSRLLKHGNDDLPPDCLPLSFGLIYLPGAEQLARIPSDSSWHLWPRIDKSLSKTGVGMKTTKLYRVVGTNIEVNIADWNRSMFTDYQSLAHQPPILERDGVPVEPREIPRPAARIALSPSSEPDTLAVRISIGVGEASLIGTNSVALLEDILTNFSPDAQLVSAKIRRATIVSALHRCWLAKDEAQRLEIIDTLAEDPAFKSVHQGHMAVHVARQLMDGPSQDEPGRARPLLCATEELGWVLVSETSARACEVIALAQEVLGAHLGVATSEYLAKDECVAELVVDTHTAMGRLEKLVTECKARGIALTYSDKPIALASLTMQVTAEKAEAVDWFELRPEVRCGDSLIPQDRWEEILAGGSYVDSSGQLRVINLASTESLKRLVHIIQVQRSETKGKRRAHEPLHVPRLRVLDWLALKKHGIECELPQADRIVLESLLEFQQLERSPLPAVRATLRDYQHEGYSWLAFLYRHGFGACLADDMGLGKTLQTITLLAAIREGKVKSLTTDDDGKSRPHLLVLPPTLLFNWQSEIKVFYPDLYVHQYTGKGRSLIGISEGVVITTYELVRRDIETLKDKPFDCVIFDEAQAVKNGLGERSQAMRQLQGRFKLCLTGTPLENHAGEYHSIIDLALPGLFGDRKTFLAELKAASDLHNPLDRARPFVLRRTKEKILKELPPKVESDVHLELTPEQKKFYTRAVGEVRAEVLAAYEDKTAQQAGIVALAALTRLRQICVSPALIDSEYTECSPKLSYLCDKLEELQAEGHAALVFSQFTRALDQLQIQLKANGVAHQRLDGSTPQDKRRTLVQAYQSGTGPAVFLISLRAGGAGLNLTRASYVFHLDPWWNPAVENQASDRAHRMGQTNTVFIQRLLMLHTVEEKIMQLKAKKRELFDQVINGSSTGDVPGASALITKDDFRYLLE